jgi:transcriptional regulator with XRE-family HTH domain
MIALPPNARRAPTNERALIAASGQLVREYREHRAMSLRALARASTVPLDRIELIEQGAVPSISAEFVVDLLYVSKALDIPTALFVEQLRRLALVH